MKIIYAFGLCFVLMLWFGMHRFFQDPDTLEKCQNHVKVCTPKEVLDSLPVNRGQSKSGKKQKAHSYAHLAPNPKLPAHAKASCPSGLETAVWYMGKHCLNWTRGFPVVDTGFAIRGGGGTNFHLRQKR